MATSAAENSSKSAQSVLEARAAAAREAWRLFGLRLRGITPSGLARFGLTVAALLGLGWLIWYTWVPLIPFMIGGVIAYILLPLVNWLDRFLPRIIGVLLALSLALAVVLLFFALLVPILTEQLYAVYLLLPGFEEIRQYRAQLNEYVATLPEPTQEIINNMFTRAADSIRANLNTYLAGVTTLAVATVLGLANTVSFVLGFLVVPAWLLTVLTEQRQARQGLDRVLPGWLKGDFWAVLRIFDRAFGAFVRGQLLTALITAVLIYGGLELVVRLFGLTGNVRYQLLLAMFAGLAQLVPSVGPFLGAIPALLIGLSFSTQVTLILIAPYIVVQQIIINFVTPYVERRVVDVHPAILIIIIVALSQFGLWWVLLAAPVTAVIRDLFRYVYGRFGSPPRPAGLLPGEPVPAPPAAAASTRPARRRSLPLIYRRQQALRQAGRNE